MLLKNEYYNESHTQIAPDQNDFIHFIYDLQQQLGGRMEVCNPGNSKTRHCHLAETATEFQSEAGK